jgi:hypothetical protein
VLTSKGVRGHFPSLLFASGFITRPCRRNFPLQLLSRALSISVFSLQPPSYVQHEKATISWNIHRISTMEKKCHNCECIRDLKPLQSEDALRHTSHQSTNSFLSFDQPSHLREFLWVQQILMHGSLPNTSSSGCSMELTGLICLRMGLCAQPCKEKKIKWNSCFGFAPAKSSSLYFFFQVGYGVFFVP